MGYNRCERKKITYPKKKRLSIAEQNIAILKKYPWFKCIWNRNYISWTGEIKPTPISNTYTIRISYTLETPPEVVVLSPELKHYKDEPIPHMYGEMELCLFYPKNNEWTRQDIIAETIIPWISEWLYFYEVWLVTGEWHGGGIHLQREARNILMEE